MPHVSIDAKPQFTCSIRRVPAELGLGFEFVTRFFANGNLAVTIRLHEVERPLSEFGGSLLGDVLQAS